MTENKDLLFACRRKEDEERLKRIMREVIQEWLDAKFAAFGRWSFYGTLAWLLAGAALLIVYSNHFPWKP